MDKVKTHYQTLRTMSAEGGCLRSDSPNATQLWPDIFVADAPTATRRRLHSQILASIPLPEPLEQPQLIITAGAPGSGKSRLVEEEIIRSAAPKDSWTIADPDQMKDRLLEAMVLDNTYRKRLVPDEVKARENANEVFFRREMAALVHEESSQLNKDLIRRAIQSGSNLVIDGVLANAASARKTLARIAFAEPDYAVTLLVVDCAASISRRRIARRWEHGYRDGLDSVASGLPVDAIPGGRLVPSELMQFVYPNGENKPSASFDVAVSIAAEFPCITSFMYHTVAEDDAARLRFTDRRQPGAPWPRLPSFTPSALG